MYKIDVDIGRFAITLYEKYEGEAPYIVSQILDNRGAPDEGKTIVILPPQKFPQRELLEGLPKLLTVLNLSHFPSKK